MRLKGKLLKWNANKAFGFITPNGGGDNIFIHKSALSNKSRTPKIGDIITFTKSKGKDGKPCAIDATFSGEKLKKQERKHNGNFSVQLSLVFLAALTLAFFAGYLPKTLLYIYGGLSVLSFIMYAIDKSKAQRGSWRTQESTLHLIALAGGWPGAAFAQQMLRHKSSKKEFRKVYWATVIVNVSALTWLLSAGKEFLGLFG